MVFYILHTSLNVSPTEYSNTPLKPSRIPHRIPHRYFQKVSNWIDTNILLFFIKLTNKTQWEKQIIAPSQMLIAYQTSEPEEVRICNIAKIYTTTPLPNISKIERHIECFQSIQLHNRQDHHN